MRGTLGNLPSFSIVVPTFRRPDALRANLEALLALDYPRDRYEVIVVDDDGGEQAAAIVRTFAGRGVELEFERQQRSGAASARNRGARVAGGELLLFVDDDILVAPDHLQRHVSAREHHGDALVGGSWEFVPAVTATLEATPFGRYRLELERGYQELDQATGVALGDGCRQMQLLGSWDLALRRELFWELGGFDEHFPVAGVEDQDFSLRAREAGCLLLLAPRIRCLHNDDRMTLRAFCEREERNAKTRPYFAARYPSLFGESEYVRENRPIRRRDQPGLIAKKLVKSALSRRPVLDRLHQLTALAERLGLPDRELRRLYRLALGLHLFRGFRSTWTG